MKRILFFALLLAVPAIAGSLAGIGPLVLNREGEQRIALFLGRPTVITKPGLAVAIATVPMRVIEARRLHLSSRPSTVQTRDGERLVVDHYVIWRIEDPLRFRESYPRTAGGDLSEAERQLDRRTRSLVRDWIGRHTLQEVLDKKRVEIMETITRRAAEELHERGVQVLDLRLNRTELPTRTEENVYARMRSERERLARKHRAEGEEEARRIRAEADREARVTVAEAQRDAEVLRGEGDASAARIYAEAHNKDPEFYGFVRSLDAYRKTIGEGTTLVLPPDHEFFQVLQGEEPE